MASTGSTDHPSSAERSSSPAVKESPAISSKKRKAWPDSEILSESQSKRRRNTALEDDEPSSESTREDFVNADKKSYINGGTEIPLSIQRVETSGTRPTVGKTQRLAMVEIVKTGNKPTQSVSPNDPLPSDVASVSYLPDAISNEAAPIRGLNSTHKKVGSDQTELYSLHPVAKKTYKAPVNKTSEGIVETSSNEESDDEAPETVTAAVSHEKVRTVAAKAAKVVKRQREAAMQKRKERDTRLKLQAKASRKRDIIHPLSTELAPDPNLHSIPIQDPPSWSANTPLPALLPDEILLAKPSPPPQKIPSFKYLHPKPLPNLKKLLVIDSKPSKDIHYGSKTIRVLEANRSLLPPRVSQTSKLLRESWLTGNRGSAGGQGQGSVPRRKLGGGFLRK